MNDYHLSSQALACLKKEHSRTKPKWEADRIKAVYLLGSGKSVSEVAFFLLKDEQTIRSYFQTYKDGGIQQLLQNNYTGKESSLTAEQEQQLIEHLRDITYRSSIDIIQYIKTTFKVTYSFSGIKHLLNRLNFTYHKPKHVPGKLDRDKQKAFLRYYRWLRKYKCENAIFLFGDACHPRGNGEPSRGWIYKGEEKQLKSNCGREHLNLNGVIDIDSLDWIITMPDRVNRWSMIELGEKILQKYPGEKKIYWILDNAKYHRAKVFKEWLRGHPRIKVLYLPSYSPNLNLMERFWKFFNERVRCNKYYEKFSDFVESAKGFFRCRTKFKTLLRTRLAENFQTF
jgi:transposase